jgi:hypothetical protein
MPFWCLDRDTDLMLDECKKLYKVEFKLKAVKSLEICVELLPV